MFVSLREAHLPIDALIFPYCLQHTAYNLPVDASALENLEQSRYTSHCSLGVVVFVVSEGAA